MRSKIFLLVFFVFATSLYAQDDINAYKYIIVPKKYEFQKTEDKHQLNSLTKFLFNKDGFLAVFEGDEMPEDLYENPCLGLKVDVLNTSGMLTTKLIIELQNCRNTKIFTSSEGKSKIKDYKRGYQEALRKAFQSVKNLNYKYDSRLATTMKLPVEETKNEVAMPIVEGQTIKAEVTNTDGKELQLDTIEEEKVEAVEAKVTKAETEKIETIEIIDSVETIKVTEDVLYAQTKPFGYQLVDSTPRVVYLLLKSSIKDVYILKNKNGIIYKKDDKWIAEYYDEDALVQKELQIKF